MNKRNQKIFEKIITESFTSPNNFETIQNSNVAPVSQNENQQKKIVSIPLLRGNMDQLAPQQMTTSRIAQGGSNAAS